MRLFTFGYKNKFSSILRSLVAIAIGIVMIISNDATRTLVQVIAALLFAAGLITLVNGFVQKRRGGGSMSISVTNAVVDVVLGLVLYLNPGIVGGIIVYLIGAALIIFGLLQVLAMYGALAQLGGGFISLGLSIMAVLFGIVIRFNPFSKAIMSILAGIALIVYGVSELVSAWKVDKAIKDYEIKFTRTGESAERVPEDGPAPTDLDEVRDIDYRRVDEQ